MTQILPKANIQQEEGVARINSRIPESLWRRAKAFAALQGISAEELTAKALESYLEANGAA